MANGNLAHLSLCELLRLFPQPILLGPDIPPKHFDSVVSTLGRQSEQTKETSLEWCKLRPVSPFEQGGRCSKSHDLIAIAICNANRKSLAIWNSVNHMMFQNSSMYWHVLHELFIAIQTAIQTEVPNHISRNSDLQIEPHLTATRGRFLQFRLCL